MCCFYLVKILYVFVKNIAIYSVPLSHGQYVCSVLPSVMVDFISSLLKNVAIYSVPLNCMLFKGDVL